MKDAIARFKRYLEQRYPGRSTSKHYKSDLAVFSRFVGDVFPREVTPKFIDSEANLSGANLDLALVTPTDLNKANLNTVETGKRSIGQSGQQ